MNNEPPCPEERGIDPTANETNGPDISFSGLFWDKKFDTLNFCQPCINR
jgi:hypothetical protein